MKFINIRYEGTYVHEYSLKFSKLLKYSPFLVSDPRDDMSRFVTRVSTDLQEECHSAMLHDNINISNFMAHAKNVEEERDTR